MPTTAPSADDMARLASMDPHTAERARRTRYGQAALALLNTGLRSGAYRGVGECLEAQRRFGEPAGRFCGARAPACPRFRTSEDQR